MKQPRASILVVDDDASLRDLLVDTLEAVGYRTTGASDGIEALQRLKQEKFVLQWIVFLIVSFLIFIGIF